MARPKKLTEEQEKEIKLLRASNEMLERTKKEAELRGKKDSIKRIERAQEDVVTQLNNLGDEIKIDSTQNVVNGIYREEDDKDINSILLEAQKAQETPKIESNKSTETIDDNVVVINDNLFDGIPNNVQYDVIALPSNGECYSNKLSRIQVSFLTAYDENIITSPNLYKDGLVIDYLLKNKVLNKSINVDDLCLGDVDAIILFLRASSYGPDFPITVTDPETKESFDTIVDLSKFNNKEFKLTSDENGWFDFELPLSKDIVKFRFLTRKDERNLRMLSQLEKDETKAVLINSARNTILNSVRGDNLLSKEDKIEITKVMDKIKEWSDKVRENANTSFSKIITNRMEMNIMAVNGNTDRKYIHQYVNTMRAKDSLELRRYILDNEPGIDWEIEVERPKSLGGGSFKTFLQWDDSVFLNIS